MLVEVVVEIIILMHRVVEQVVVDKVEEVPRHQHVQHHKLEQLTLVVELEVLMIVLLLVVQVVDQE
jgi:hypothetical protein